MVNKLKVYTTDTLNVPQNHSFKLFKEIDTELANKVISLVKPKLRKMKLKMFIIIKLKDNDSFYSYSTWLFSKDLK